MARVCWEVVLSLESTELFSWDAQVNSLERVVMKSKPGCTRGHGSLLEI